MYLLCYKGVLFFLVCVFVVVGSFLSNSIDFLFQEKFLVFLLVFRIFQYNSIGLSQVQLWPKNVVHYKVETGFNFSTIYIIISGGRDQGVVLRARPRAKRGLVNNRKEKKCPRLVCFITLDFFVSVLHGFRDKKHSKHLTL